MPDSFAESSEGLLLVANGIDKTLRFNGQGDMETAGLNAPETAISIAFGGVGSITGEYFAFERFVDGEGNLSNLSPVSPGVVAASASVVTYGNLVAPSDGRVVRRQLLRNTAGQTTTFYVDVDTQDLYSLSINSNNTDSVLQTNEAVPLFDTDGKPLANRYDPPPADRALIAQHLNRMFMAGGQPYAEGSAKVVFGLPTVEGIGTIWKPTFAGRFLYVSGAPKSYEIVSVTGQEILLTEIYTGPSNPYAEYSIEPAPATRNLIYYSESSLPEAWPPFNAFEVTEDGDEITGLMPMASFLYVLKRKKTYRFSAKDDPASDGFVFLSIGRGCVNDRCWAIVGSNAYLLDESGIYVFDGSESKDLTLPIDGIFAGYDPNYRVNWAVSRFFHAVLDESLTVVRFFVTLGGDYLPRHCVAYDYQSNSFWVERYPRPISSSHHGRTGFFTETWRTRSGQQTYFGSTGKRVLGHRTSDLDGIDPRKGNTRFGVTSSTNFGVTLDLDPPPSILGLAITVARGSGKGQTRTIESVSGKTLTLSRPWTTKPNPTSVIQLGGIAYQYRSGKFQYVQVEARNPRTIRVFHQPSAVSGDRCDLRMFSDWSASPLNWYTEFTERENYGITTTKGSPDAEIDLTKSQGKTSLRSDGNRETNLDSPTYLTYELEGVSSESPLSVRQIILEGVAGGQADDQQN